VEISGADPSVRAGLAVLDGRRVVIVAMDRHAQRAHGVDAKPGPEAFRLAQRAVRMADRLGLPVVTLVDTAGADPSPASEAAGIAREISGLLLAMAELGTPSATLVVGEGGSGGAMAFAHADRLFLLTGAVFSVIGPEPGAAILYRDAARAPALAHDFRLTPGELLDLGVISQVLEEDPGLVRLALADALTPHRPSGRDARPDGVTARALTYPAWPLRPFHHPKHRGEA
jgi:acetyl-CoA carboxylase alpha subunit